MKKKNLPASFTIEASLVMPIALFSIALIISAGFRLHDIVIGNLVVNEAAELYGHLPENGDGGSIEAYGNSRLMNVLADTNYSMTIEDYKEGCRVELSFDGGGREYEDAGSRPEKMMRKLTLIEAFLDD
ncbi:MAG: hypothetical protein Q4E57_05450 [Eubacteriales bacterium]|nr:hypothetical protein [Eubacteriales bacterium]